MQSITKEINNFIKSISQRELEENPKLKKDIENLSKSLDRLHSSCKEKQKNVLKYLNRTLLISK